MALCASNMLVLLREREQTHPIIEVAIMSVLRRPSLATRLR